MPEPVLISQYVDDTIKLLKEHKFTGDNLFLAAHSLGGVIAQDFVPKRDDIKGQILMGSVLLRKQHKITASGETHFNYTKPTLTILGEKDGLLRFSRGAEA